jgi:hypothetical protein
MGAAFRTSASRRFAPLAWERHHPPPGRMRVAGANNRGKLAQMTPDLHSCRSDPLACLDAWERESARKFDSLLKAAEAEQQAERARRA